MRSPVRPVRASAVMAAALALGVLLAACGQPTPSTVPRNCGTEEQTVQGGPNVDGRRCLLEAFADGQQAVFISHLTTMEGDPILRRYTVLGPELVQIEHDARQDRFGSGQIEVLHCPRLVAVAEWNEAMGESMRAEEVFVEDGCELVESRD